MNTKKMIKNKEVLVDNLCRGDLISLWGTQRMVRGVYSNANNIKTFYFAKLRKSGYPSPFTSYSIYTIRDQFVGLVKRNCCLHKTTTEIKVQATIDLWIDHLSCNNGDCQCSMDDADRFFIQENESVGKII